MQDYLLSHINRPMFTVSGTEVTAATLLSGLVPLAITVVLAFGISRAFQQAIQKRGLENSGSLASIRRLVVYFVWIIGVATTLDSVGVHLSALFAAGAIFAVGIGLAMQDVAKNFVSGVILLVERSITPGDILEFDDTICKVLRVGIRTTIVKTPDDYEIIIPNNDLVQLRVKNRTLIDRHYRISIPVGIHYKEEPEHVRKTLLEIGRAQNFRDHSREPIVLMEGFGASSVDYRLCIWTRQPWHTAQHQSKLGEAIWAGLRKANIEIAFPQVDVHMIPKA